MAHPPIEFLNGSAKRSTNLLTAAQAENFTSGWSATGVTVTQSGSTYPTPFNGYTGAANTPWGHANALVLTSGTGFVSLASAGITGLTTLGANVIELNCFVHRPASNPVSSFALVVRDTVASVTHSVTFAWAMPYGWSVSSSSVGATGRIVEEYPDGWYRVAIAYQVGWIGAGDTTATSSAYQLRLQLVGSVGQGLDVWGANLTTAVYAAPVSDSTAPATYLLSNPVMPAYMDGVTFGSQRLRYTTQGTPLLCFPTRSLFSTGQFQTSIQSGGTADAGLQLLGRISENAPWTVVQARVEGDMVNGTKIDAVTLYPQMRLCITELAADNNTTIGAWLVE